MSVGKRASQTPFVGEVSLYHLNFTFCKGMIEDEKFSQIPICIATTYVTVIGKVICLNIATCD